MSPLPSQETLDCDIPRWFARGSSIHGRTARAASDVAGVVGGTGCFSDTAREPCLMIELSCLMIEVSFLMTEETLKTKQHRPNPAALPYLTQFID